MVSTYSARRSPPMSSDHISNTRVPRPCWAQSWNAPVPLPSTLGRKGKEDQARQLTEYSPTIVPPPLSRSCLVFFLRRQVVLTRLARMVGVVFREDELVWLWPLRHELVYSYLGISVSRTLVHPSNFTKIPSAFAP